MMGKQLMVDDNRIIGEDRKGIVFLIKTFQSQSQDLQVWPHAQKCTGTNI